MFESGGKWFNSVTVESATLACTDKREVSVKCSDGKYYIGKIKTVNAKKQTVVIEWGMGNVPSSHAFSAVFFEFREKGKKQVVQDGEQENRARAKDAIATTSAAQPLVDRTASGRYVFSGRSVAHTYAHALTHIYARVPCPIFLQFECM